MLQDPYEESHYEAIRQGVGNWHAWRKANPGIQPDLKLADLRNANLWGADLWDVNLWGAKLS